MKEFMLLIRNRGEHVATMSPIKHEQFLRSCEKYISDLKKEGKLIGAKPMAREGMIISGANGVWKDKPFNDSDEVIVGYYHIRADNIDDAVDIAKKNPEFHYTTTARIEVRPLKMKEQTTDFVYPGGA